MRWTMSRPRTTAGTKTLYMAAVRAPGEAGQPPPMSTRTVTRTAKIVSWYCSLPPIRNRIVIPNPHHHSPSAPPRSFLTTPVCIARQVRRGSVRTRLQMRVHFRPKMCLWRVSGDRLLHRHKFKRLGWNSMQCCKRLLAEWRNLPLLATLHGINCVRIWRVLQGGTLAGGRLTRDSP
jgi:hypothetical protein